jgi:hypothetical protein
MGREARRGMGNEEGMGVRMGAGRGSGRGAGREVE